MSCKCKNSRCVCFSFPLRCTVLRCTALHCAAHSGHKLALFSAFFHAASIPRAARSLYCITTRSGHLLGFPSVSCYTLWARRFLPSAACGAHLHARSASHARLFLSPSIAHGYTLSVFVPHSCSTAQCLAQIDWLTCRISSTSSSSAIGIGNPLLFGAGVHRSDWPSCTSSLLCSWCTRTAKARRDPSDRSAFEFHCEPLRRTSSRYRVSTLSHWFL
jgi:hypothetical protein